MDSFNPDESRNHKGNQSRNYGTTIAYKSHKVGDPSFDRAIDEDMSNQGEENPVSFRASLKNQKKNAYEEYDERPVGGNNRRGSAWDEVPVGGSLKKAGGYYDPNDERPIKGSKGPNPFEARENIPVGGKGAYIIPEDESFANQTQGTETKTPKKAFLTRKAKYDPRKAIEEAKKREEEYNFL